MATPFPLVFTSSIQFTALRREHTVVIPSDVIRSIADIDITFYLQPGGDTPSVQVHRDWLVAGFAGPDNVRFYLNGTDVTIATKQVLKTLIEKQPPDKVAVQYIKSAQAYLRTTRDLDIRESAAAGDAGVAEQYAKSGDWSGKLDKADNPTHGFGDHTVGWKGNLHLCHYLYRAVDCEPISLNSVIRNYNAIHANAFPTKLSDLDALRITFSQGTAPSYEPIDASVIPTGEVHYAIRVLYAHEIIQRIRRELIEVRKALSSEGELATGLAQARDYLKRMSGEMRQLESLVRAETQQIDHLKLIAESVERKLNLK